MPLAWTAIDLSKVFTGASTLERTESLPPTPNVTGMDRSAIDFSDVDSIVSAGMNPSIL